MYSERHCKLQKLQQKKAAKTKCRHNYACKVEATGDSTCSQDNKYLNFYGQIGSKICGQTCFAAESMRPITNLYW